MVRLFDERYIEDMSYIRFVADNTFHIEKSMLYSKIGENIKSVEFIRLKDKELLFIEAKTTFPNPDNSSEENFERLQIEVNEICEKFIHSLNLFSSIKTYVNEDEFAADFALSEKVSLVFMLVIKNHEPLWCRKLKPIIIAALPVYMKRIWKPEVRIINHATAIRESIALD